MPSRRFHSKNRHGCITCKVRRVKCDLERPKCRNCARRNEKCEFTHGPHLGEPPNVNPWLCSRPSDFDIVLLERFCSQVVVTLSGRKESQRLWASTVVQKTSYKYPYLAHCVLAVSALHLSETSHFSAAAALSYRNLGIHHQNAALSFFRSQLDRITAENCDALFASAWLVFLFTVAFPRRTDKSTLLLDEIVDMSELGKGVHTVLKGAPGNPDHGPLRAWFIYFRHWDSPDMLLPEHVSRPLRRMREMIDTYAEELKRTIYIFAVEKLKLTLAAFTVNAYHPAFIYMWLVEVDRDFLELVRSRDRIALYIFGHYGVCARRVADQWWARDWGRDIVTAVQCVLETLDGQTPLAEQIRQIEGS